MAAMAAAEISTTALDWSVITDSAAQGADFLWGMSALSFRTDVCHL